MKIKRSTKCSLKFCTASKKQELSRILKEYGGVVNFFINEFWGNCLAKYEIKKDIYSLSNSWLSATLKQRAAFDAIDMVGSARKRWGDKSVKPIHKGNKIQATQQIAKLVFSKSSTEFDAWLHLRSIGNKIILDLPIKFHKHYNLLSEKGKQLNSYILTKDYVQFVFEIETGPKKTEGKIIGLDTGVNSLATLSTGEQFGEIKPLIEKINRCKYGSKRQKKLRRALKHRMDEVAKEIVTDGIQLLVTERLKGLKYKIKAKRRLAKNMRRVIGTWTYSYWLDRLQQGCQWNRVSWRSVDPKYTSQMCSSCGHIDKKNRSRETFRCLSCGYEDNADVNAARNILERFISGPYGAGYKDCSE